MNDTDLSRRVAGVAAAAFALAGVAGFLPHSNWWWGFDTLRFYPLPARLAWLAAIYAALGVAWWLGGRRAAGEVAAAGAAPEAPDSGTPAGVATAEAASDNGTPITTPEAGSRGRLPPLLLAGLLAIGAGLFFYLARARHFLA